MEKDNPAAGLQQCTPLT